ncbi:hypothetical protein J1N35_004396 [Gossypium stocksii]|uniref:Aminotransferase-like plant mobile domain-containing protein n=1 Tax=Gossypium stocksii TaxID=47602 RepID=A0A9D4AIA7_9ROSI|nr:hypothetical protein J1N35_004396 [Gossypium stocksii]
MLIPRALSSDRSVYEDNGQLLPSTVVLGTIPNAISRISEPPTMGNCTGNRAIVHGTYFIWMPYVEDDIATLIPAWVIEQQQLFVSNVPLINFHILEWHDKGHVLRQFACAQPIPNPPVNISEVYGMDKRGSGRDSLNWAQKHEPYIFLWNDRHSRRPPLYVLVGGFSSTREYTAWYMAHEKPFIYQGRYMLIQRDAQPKSSQWQQRNAQPHRNRVPPFGNIEYNTASNPNLEPQYEASSSSSHHPEPESEQEIPLSFEDIFGDDLDPQHSTWLGSSSYHERSILKRIHLSLRIFFHQHLWPRNIH